jgi:hypothetical protein
MQTHKFSWFESISNTSIGFIISFIIQIIIYPILNIDVKFSQNIIITSVFTIASILRGYIVRRLFNKFDLKH